jgi:hypothetical protein
MVVINQYTLSLIHTTPHAVCTKQPLEMLKLQPALLHETSIRSSAPRPITKMYHCGEHANLDRKQHEKQP